MAGAFYAAGAKDILVGVEWPWLIGKQKKKDKHRTEIDVVFPWGPHQVAVSVKASSLAGGKNVPAACDEIRAMAVECLGRLSLPVLVYHALPQKASRSFALARMKKWGVLVIADTLLCNPVVLRSLLDEAFSALMKSG